MSLPDSQPPSPRAEDGSSKDLPSRSRDDGARSRQLQDTDQTRSTYESKAWTLLAGKEQIEALIHESLLSKFPFFAPMMETGKWEEGQRRMVKMADWDKDTINRFAEFLYTGDFVVPGFYDRTATSHPFILKDQNDHPWKQQYAGINGSHTYPRNCYGQKTPYMQHVCPNSLAYATFRHWCYLHFHLETFEYKSSDCENIMKPLANLYMLADYIGAPELKNIAYWRITTILHFFQRMEDKAGLVKWLPDFASFVYSNTTCTNEQPDSLRQRISFFISKISDSFSGKDIHRIMVDGGDLAVDIMGHMCHGGHKKKKRRSSTSEQSDGKRQRYHPPVEREVW